MIVLWMPCEHLFPRSLTEVYCVSLPDDHHLLRYCKPTAVSHDGFPLAAAFEIRKGEEHLSVKWLEYFNKQDLGSAFVGVPIGS